MESFGSTLISQSFIQERIVRDAPSANSWAMEIHKVTTSGAGAGTLYTSMDKIIMVFCGIDGTSGADACGVDLDGGVYNSTTGLYAVPVAGANSTVYTIMILGNFEGA